MKLFFKKLFVFTVPFILLIALYIIIDPYKTIKHYNIYLPEYIMLNRGDISTRVFLSNYKKYKFDSFIFGSSRSCAYTGKEWSRYLPEGSKTFSFGGWVDPIEGIYRRLALVDSLNNTIKNVLIIVDIDDTFIRQDANPVAGDHYLISKKSLFDYHLMGIINYYSDPLTVITSIDYSLFHAKRGYMKKFIGMEAGDLDPINNDWGLNSEYRILSDSANYYKRLLKTFYKRPPQQRYSGIQLSPNKQLLLKKIREIFDRRHTHYKFVLSPLYDQVKFNPFDLNTLVAIFGKENIYDYSGINAKTADMYNFSDNLHYRKKLGACRT
ncbi:hypothetical protein BH09BAC6_BH09BAC6_15340 [soil metagenome]